MEEQKYTYVTLLFCVLIVGSPFIKVLNKINWNNTELLKKTLAVESYQPVNTGYTTQDYSLGLGNFLETKKKLNTGLNEAGKFSKLSTLWVVQKRINQKKEIINEGD